MQWAFEAYATGEYTLRELTEALDAKGLTTRPAGKRTARPLGHSRVAKMLRSPFYIGLVVWGGRQFPGRHKPLVTIETFAMVQALMDSRDQSEYRQARHDHYLKGTLRCARCESRLSFSRYHGNGGKYDYFVCLGRTTNRTGCDLPYIAPEQLEEAMERHYASITLSDLTISRIKNGLRELLAKNGAETAGAGRRQRQRIAKLERERRKLLDAHLADAIPLDLLKEKQDRITRQLADAQAALADAERGWEGLEVGVSTALDLGRC